MIISLSGKKSSGKSEVARYLNGHYRFKKKAFAHRLKLACAGMTGLSEPYFNESNLKEGVVTRLGMSPREIMQRLGVAMRREFGEDIWINLLALENLASQTEHDYVIEDTRFKNELSAIKRCEGITVKIERPGLESSDSHVSENDLNEEEFDFVICNDKGLEELYLEVDKVMLTLGYLPNDLI